MSFHQSRQHGLRNRSGGGSCWAGGVGAPPSDPRQALMADDFESSVANLRRRYNLYQAAGYLTPVTVLSVTEAANAHTAFEEWAATLPGGRVAGDLRFRPHLHLPFANALVHHPTVVEAAAAVLDTPNVLLWSSDFNLKEPGSGGYFALHQDATYTGLKPAKGVTVWLALSDPVDERSGCMTFVEGSHKLGQLPHVEEEDGCGADKGVEHNMLSRNQRVVDSMSGEPGAGGEVLATLRAGQGSLHSFLLLHKSAPNRSSKPRIGLALRYIAASVRQTGRVREAVTLVSGKLEHDGFDLEPLLPLGESVTNDDLERGRVAHRDSMQRESANYFYGTEAVKAYDEAQRDAVPKFENGMHKSKACPEQC